MEEEMDIGNPSPGCDYMWFVTCPITPCLLMYSYHVVEENHDAVVLRWGKLLGIEREPGCKFYHCCSSTVIPVSKKQTSIRLPTTKIIDSNGNPLIVSAVVVYSIVNTKKAILDVQNVHSYIQIIATSILKYVVSQYPYEDWGLSQSTKVCLKDEPEEIQRLLITALQKKVTKVGAKIHSFRLNEISYSEEISQVMLKRQRAEAFVHAKNTIVEGAVDISFDSVNMLAQKGLVLTPEEKSKLVSDLLITMCADAKIQPTIKIGNE